MYVKAHKIFLFCFYFLLLLLFIKFIELADFAVGSVGGKGSVYTVDITSLEAAQPT
jgi:hypothetical protein